MTSDDMSIELTLEEGFLIYSNSTEKNPVVDGYKVTKPPGLALFMAQREHLYCTCCGLKADKWKTENRNQNKPPFLDLYGLNHKGENILFTRDHIIPKVFGGNDDLTNFRVMCEICNSVRGCEMDEEDLNFYSQNISRNISTQRLQDSIHKLLRGLKSKTYHSNDARIILSGFELIFEHLKKEKTMNVTFQGFYRQIIQMKPILAKNIIEENQE